MKIEVNKNKDRSMEYIEAYSMTRKFSDQARVKSLTVSETMIRGGFIRYLARYNELEELNMSAAGINDNILKNLPAMDQLKILRLDHARLDGSGLGCLVGLEGLQKLFLNGIKSINDDSLPYLRGPVGLKELYLNNTGITDHGLKHLSIFPGLSKLSICSPGIYDAGLEHLSQFPLLQELHLDGTGITDKSVSFIAELKNLHLISLVSSAMTENGIKKLEMLMPDCEVRY